MTQNMILQYLSECPTTQFTTREISDQFEISPDAALNALKRLLAKGKVMRSKLSYGNVWQLTPTPVLETTEVAVGVTTSTDVESGGTP